ncbi:hypothetical protein Stsp01_49070 [Streptomyces sp. NBRC 13847]|uniref:IPT/TIG domain-containing protein n=1 Tax=Streptomyces TaxID=1883 RepID=UPI0024A47AEB|nr:IPT/TIG domain-containing protein [Streptomyces sp. NBRC 13847]GLW18164.1 hypothetical protein Stsp01_49070 [Streptomyces sp. NBRC 13847]
MNANIPASLRPYSSNPADVGPQITAVMAAGPAASLSPSLQLLLTTLPTTTIPAGSGASVSAVAPNGNVYVINVGANNVTVINSATNTVIATVPVGTLPQGVAAAPNGNVYVVNNISNSVTVISSTTNTVIATVPVGAAPFGVAVAPNGNVYVANGGAGSVTVINSATNTVITTLPAGTGPRAVAVAPNGNVYVTNGGSDDVTVIDSATNTVIANVPTGVAPNALAVAPNGNVYVIDSGSDSVTVIDSTTNTVLAIFPISGPVAVAAGPNGLVYVVSGNMVTAIDSASNTIVATAPTGPFSNAVSVAPNNTAYVSNLGFTVTAVGPYPAPTVANISPSTGPASGNTVITITGTNLTAATVTIGGNPATVVSVNAAGTQLTAITPPGAVGPATVTVTTPGGTATLPGGFTYQSTAPTLVLINPTCGPVAGGTLITILGTNLTGASVTIGAIPALGVTVNPSGTQLTAIVPPGAAGPATVTVTTPSGSASLPGAFTYAATPTLTGITPNNGPAAGGTVVTITGTNLTGATVTIGGTPATCATVNPAGTQITATTPPGAVGPATVTVTTCGGTASLPGGFTYNSNTPHATTLTATPALVQLFPLQLHFPFLSATLIDNVTGLPVPGQTITFSTGGHVLGTAVTDATGTARHPEVLALALIILNGGYDATFAGTATLQPATAHGGVLTF